MLVALYFGISGIFVVLVIVSMILDCIIVETINCKKCKYKIAERTKLDEWKWYLCKCRYSSDKSLPLMLPLSPIK